MHGETKLILNRAFQRLGIFIVGIAFWYIENSFFGWHARPHSEAEVICDGITSIIFALSMLVN